jgi:hypothetical protein
VIAFMICVYTSGNGPFQALYLELANGMGAFFSYHLFDRGDSSSDKWGDQGFRIISDADAPTFL